MVAESLSTRIIEDDDDDDDDDDSWKGIGSKEYNIIQTILYVFLIFSPLSIRNKR